MIEKGNEGKVSERMGMERKGSGRGSREIENEDDFLMCGPWMFGSRDSNK